jgi:anti-sigma regulatory factor (Ser/Thr protein kinase)
VAALTAATVAASGSNRLLAAWGMEELGFSTELVFSELVTNAIRYGREPIKARLLLDNSLICEVSDAGETSPRPRRAADTDEGGRGLYLVAQLAERWGTRYTRRGKVIWAELSLTDRDRLIGS